MHRRRFLLLLSLCLSTLVTPVLAEPTSRAPILLVAAEDTDDPNFSRSVVLVVFPTDGEPMGVILNKTSELAIKDAFPDDKQLRTRSDKVWFGGPVRLDLLTYLVRSNRPPKEGYKVIDNLYLTQDASFLDTLLARRGKVERYFLGSAVWLPEQLDAEIEAHRWFVLPADIDTILNGDPERMWRNLLARATAVET